MARSRPYAWLLMLTGIALLTLAVLLLTVNPTQAQCGSSSTSCKNCHEVNAEYPVNGSGDWHISHAFGDFCAFCHAGNVQATEQDPAHEGMIYPLSDPQGSCQSCHPNDYLEQAQVYAVALGVDLGADDITTRGSDGGSSGGESASPADIPPEPIAAPGERHASGALIDYNRRYEIEVLGQFDTSQTGNLILAVMALAMLGVGGILLWRFEGLGDVWRQARAVPEDDWRRLAYSGAYDVRGPVLPSTQASAAPTPPSAAPAPPPRAALPDELESLDNETKAVLGRLLADPEHGGAILRALGRLDPALIDSLQSLDKKDRDLLLAIVEQLGESAS